MEKISHLTIQNGDVLYVSKFSKHVYEPTTGIFYTDWFEETSEMFADDFKQEMIAWLEASRKVNFRLLLDRCVDFNYPISPEAQIWMAQLLNKPWADAGLQKYAHIVPDAFISSLSVEQTFEEFFNMNLTNQYPIKDFSNLEAALAWLKA